VLRSNQAYLVAAFPFIIFNGREGLEALQGFARIDGGPLGLPDAWLHAEFALERNSRIDMKAYGYYAEAGYRFSAWPFAPTLSYTYATFSGDDASTPQFERFDPLFYSGSQNNWAFGSNSSYAFQNANVNFNRVTLQLAVSETDAWRFQYIHTRANQLTTIILGPVTHLPVLAGLNLNIGLRDHHLADEIYWDWKHRFQPTVKGTLWASLTFPGAGLRSLPLARTEPWFGFGATLTMSTPDN
jgi:hypothetical protein